MELSSDRDFEKIKDLLDEAYSSGMYRKSAEIARRGVELARDTESARWRIHFLFWHGAALIGAGDTKAAQIPLLDGARPDPEANPADQYNSICALIWIALYERDVGYCRGLLAQGRNYLAGVCKEAWSHKLDVLNGDLEVARGAFEAAQTCYHRAWHSVQQPNYEPYPSYTTASYPFYLAETAFALRDAVALSRWRVELEGCEEKNADDKVYETTCHLLFLRSRRTKEGMDAAVPAALELLNRVHALECSDRDGQRVALRTLALAGHWAAVDDWIARLSWDSFGFKDQLFRGDERLCRARHAVGIPAVDDEWDQALEEMSPPPTTILEPANRDQAATFLAEARSHYESVRTKAEAEDHRLETAWYASTLNQRLARLTALLGALR